MQASQNEYHNNGLVLKAANPDPRVVEFLYNHNVEVEIAGEWVSLIGLISIDKKEIEDFVKKIEVEDKEEILSFLNINLMAKKKWKFSTNDRFFRIRITNEEKALFWNLIIDKNLTAHFSVEEIKESTDWCLQFGIEKNLTFFDLISLLKKNFPNMEEKNQLNTYTFLLDRLELDITSKFAVHPEAEVHHLVFFGDVATTSTSILSKLFDTLMSKYSRQLKQLQAMAATLSTELDSMISSQLTSFEEGYRKCYMELCCLILSHESSIETVYKKFVTFSSSDRDLNLEAKLVITAIFNCIKNEKVNEISLSIYHSIRSVFSFLPKEPSQEAYNALKLDITKQIEEILCWPVKYDEEVITTIEEDDLETQWRLA